MSITPTVGNGFYVTHKRCDIRMSRRTRTYDEAVETLRMMREDLIVDLPKKRYIFHPDRILIITKPNFTDKKYKCCYLPSDFK
jgi:hypothetical protein